MRNAETKTYNSICTSHKFKVHYNVTRFYNVKINENLKGVSVVSHPNYILLF